MMHNDSNLKKAIFVGCTPECCAQTYEHNTESPVRLDDKWPGKHRRKEAHVAGMPDNPRPHLPRDH